MSSLSRLVYYMGEFSNGIINMKQMLLQSSMQQNTDTTWISQKRCLYFSQIVLPSDSTVTFNISTEDPTTPQIHCYATVKNISYLSDLLKLTAS